MSERFEFHSKALDGLVVVRRSIMGDNRGWFGRMFCAEEYKEIGFEGPILQINHSYTGAAGSVRGLHYQRHPHAEKKIVACISGSVFDVAVDIRQGSSTFLQWHGEVLSADNRLSMVIPEGFAHGFQTLESNCELIYFHTEYYSPESEGALNVADPKIAINWPLPFTELSERDRNHPLIDTKFKGIWL